MRVLQGPDYRPYSEKTCPRLENSDVVHSGGFIRATASTSFSGRCTAEQDLFYEFSVAQNQAVEATLTFYQDTKGEVGNGGTISSSLAEIRKPSDQNKLHFFERLECLGFPFLLEAFYCEKSVNTRRSITITGPGTYFINVRASAASYSGVGYSFSEAKVRQFRATLKFRPN